MTLPEARRRPFGALPAALLFLLLVLAAFWPVVVGRRSFFHLDLYYEHLPVWAATQKALRSGQSPFWIDGEYCGHPPLFHQEAPLFYPLTTPLLLTGAPVHRLADLFSLFHFWLAGLSAFLLARELTGNPAAGLFGGVAWMLSARMVQTAIWPNAVAASALVPLGLWGLARIAKGERRSGVAWAAAAGGLALLSARPQVLLAAAPIAIALVAALLVSATDRRRALRGFGLAALLAISIGAPSILPSALLLPETSRGQGSLGVGGDPRVLSRGRGLDLLFLPVERPGRWPEGAAYAGVLPGALFVSGLVVLAAAAGDRRRRALLVACFVGGAAGLAFAFGTRGPYRFVAEWPVLRGFRVPERFLFSWSFAIALGAALALSAWVARSRRPGLWAAAAVALAAVDLVPHARATAPTAESSLYDVVPEAATSLRRDLGVDAAGFPKRYFSLAMPLDVTPFPDAERVRLLREADALKGALGLRFGLEAVGGAGPGLARTEEVVLRPLRRSFALGAAGALLLSAERADGKPDEYAPPRIEPAEGLPRAFLVAQSVIARPEDAAAAALSPSIEPSRTVVLEEGEPLTRAASWSDGAASVRLTDRTPARVRLEARAPGPAYLVLLDSWEAGWSASLDGEPADVLRADGAFRAVKLPPGAHRVEFTYAPRGLFEGLGLGAAGILGLVLAAIRLQDEPAG